MLSAVGGGCRLPLGAWARIEDGDGEEDARPGFLRLVLVAALVTPDGLRSVELAGEPGDAAALGRRAAERLR